jgi:hypothetical protein
MGCWMTSDRRHMEVRKEEEALGSIRYMNYSQLIQYVGATLD